MYITREPMYRNLKSKFILIKDSRHESGVKILKAVLNTLLKEDVKLHVINYELLNLNLLCSEGDEHNISKTDSVSDPLNWNEPSEAKQNFLSLSVLSQFALAFKGVICFDSLSPLLFHNNPNSVYKSLHKILKENTDLQIIALMHTDVHYGYVNEIMEKMATTILNIIPFEDKCTSTVRYSSGKVTNQVIEYKVSENCEFSVLRDFLPQIKSTQTKQPDPTANLTFNLRLKDDEKEARSQVQLPYMQMQNQDVIEADNYMYDEEDPDDDLDI